MLKMIRWKHFLLGAGTAVAGSHLLKPLALSAASACKGLLSKATSGTADSDSGGENASSSHSGDQSDDLARALGEISKIAEHVEKLRQQA